MFKNKQHSILSQELMQASRQSGADAQSSPRLAAAIARAKKAGYPKASIKSAIARGQGLSSTGAALEPLIVEAILPSSVAIVIDCQTDNKARTLQDLRTVVKRHGAVSTPTSYLFDKRGRTVFDRDERDLKVDDVLEQAIDAGADDVEADESGNIVVYTVSSQTTATASKLSPSLNLKIQSSEILWYPNVERRVSIDSYEAIKALDDLVEEVYEDPCVQGVYSNASRST